MSSRILYISKLNLVSHQIFNAYDEPKALKRILAKLFGEIDDKLEHQRMDINNIEGNDITTYEATYKFSSIEKIENTIIGNLIKTSKLKFEVKVEDTDQLESDEAEFSQIIHFYFDVFKEKVVFFTKNRFGYDEFNIAFTRLINEYVNLKNDDEKYIFEIETIKQAANIETIQNELEGLGKIKELIITIKPPNPDDPLLDEISINIEEYLENIKEGNITTTSSLFNSTASEGLKLKSKIVMSEFEKINLIHSKLSDVTALQNNYVVVEAETKSGRRYSTKKRRPLTIEIKEHQTYGLKFIEACKSIISLF